MAEKGEPNGRKNPPKGGITYNDMGKMVQIRQVPTSENKKLVP
jgi:hypothetical protein